MSIFPTTRIGRALVAAALVTGAVKIVPFLLQVFSLAGDELTELPPLTPAGTTRSFLLANPVTWFLAVAVITYVLLLGRDLVARWTAPPPPPSRRPRASARKPAATKAAAKRPAPRKPAPTKAAPRKAVAARTASAGRPAARTPARTASRTAGTARKSTAKGSTTTTRRPASRR